MTSTMTAQTPTNLEIVCLCEGEWRLCDARIPASDSRRLISYVEQSGDDFEMLWLPTLAVQHMTSLEACIEAATRYCSRRPRSDVRDMTTTKRKGR
jgi:hypothetical protein